MRVGTVMRQPVVVVAPDDILVDAAAWMARAAIDVAPVCVDGRLVGLLVGRDVVARARAAGCDPTTATVRDLMTTDPIHGQAEHDLVAADRLMRQRKIGQLAILDDDKRLVGVESASGRVRIEVVTMTMEAGTPTDARRRRLRRARSRLTPRAFERLVQDTLDALPPWVQERLAEVAVVVEAEPPAHEDPDLLGLYSGPTLFEHPSLAAPPLIRIFQGPHERLCHTHQELRREVVETVLHEVAHHFGFDETDIARLGPLRLPDPP